MTFDVYGLTADEARRTLPETKAKTRSLDHKLLSLQCRVLSTEMKEMLNYHCQTNDSF
jgi:hypothetical protein